MRRHGWQLPLHPLQFVGMGVFTFLVVFFYVFLGPFLGNRTAESAVLTLFSFTVFSIAALYIRCTAIDPSDQTIYRKKRKVPKFNSRSIAVHLILRITKKIEHKILKCCIRRKYLNPWNNNAQMDTVMPFSFLVMDDTITPQVKDDEITFCSLCDFEVKRCSKHCRTCNRCVDGFDHHCRWLNNCIGRRNYTTFILLLVFTMLMLALEAGSAAAIFIRCFASKSISMELKHKLHTEFPKEILAAISVLLAALTAYISAALGQLFIFHVELIRKGMRTYDYILAMREESRQSIDHLDDFDLSSDDSDYESPRNSKFISRFLCNGHKEKQVISLQNSQELFNPANSEKHEIKIDPWKLIRMSKEKANMAAKNARERLVRQKQIALISPLKPLPLEKKKGPIEITKERCGITQDASNLWISSSTGTRFSSPRRRFSSSPSQKCKSDFDLKLMETSKEIETCIYV